MSGSVLVWVNGEVLANGHGPSIANQNQNAKALAEGLLPLFISNNRITILHGNKPQVGFVLFRSEIASHVLHAIPLDVCGADTQGATGYMLSQAFINVLRKQNFNRDVLCVLTQTLVDPNIPQKETPLRAIGPWFDRDKAERYRNARHWEIVEDPGRGYRRAVPTYPVIDVIEIENIKNLVNAGTIVIAGGGGGIPVIQNAEGQLEGIEAVVESEQLLPIMAEHVDANVLLMVIESDNKFILSGLYAHDSPHISHECLQTLIQDPTIKSNTVKRALNAAQKFLNRGGEQVIVTTLDGLNQVFNQGKGLRIGSRKSSIMQFNIADPNGVSNE